MCVCILGQCFSAYGHKAVFGFRCQIANFPSLFAGEKGMLNTGFLQKLTWNLSPASSKKTSQNSTRKNRGGKQVCPKYLVYFFRDQLQEKMLLITFWEYLNILYGTTYSWWLPCALEHPLTSSGYCHRKISGRSQALLGNLWPTWKLLFCNLCSYLGQFAGPIEVILLSQLIQF